MMILPHVTIIEEMPDFSNTLSHSLTFPIPCLIPRLSFVVCVVLLFVTLYILLMVFYLIMSHEYYE